VSQPPPPEPSPFRRWLATLLPYVVAGVLYIALGVWQPRFLLSWSEGIIFLMLVVWGIPELWRRRRR
jgi:hypothetical protein